MMGRQRHVKAIGVVLREVGVWNGRKTEAVRGYKDFRVLFAILKKPPQPSPKLTDNVGKLTYLTTAVNSNRQS